MNVRELSLRALIRLCSVINRHDIKSLNSYKLSCKFIEDMGFIYQNVEYEKSYLIEDLYIDTYSCLKGRILIYANENEVIGCRVLNAPYLSKKFFKAELKGYKALETGKYIVYER